MLTDLLRSCRLFILFAALLPSINVVFGQTRLGTPEHPKTVSVASVVGIKLVGKKLRFSLLHIRGTTVNYLNKANVLKPSHAQRQRLDWKRCGFVVWGRRTDIGRMRFETGSPSKNGRPHGHVKSRWAKRGGFGYCRMTPSIVESWPFPEVPSMSSQPARPLVSIGGRSKTDEHQSRARVRSHESNELFFAVVGHVGSGTTLIAQQLDALLKGLGYESRVLKARDEITSWAEATGRTVPKLPVGSLEGVEQLQDLGDQMRGAGDHAAVATALALRIRATRASYLNKDPNNVEPIMPDGTKRAYILDSLRHPEEVRLLQKLYGGAFMLIGVVCTEDIRRQRLVDKYTGADSRSAEEFMRRDEGVTTEKYGQHVADAFEMADFYLDNSEPRNLDNERANSAWDIPDQLSRLLKIMMRNEIQRPTAEETAMHAAHGGQLRSACMSRQVGAALIDDRGNIVALGTNEVPRAGGGLYGEYWAEDDGGFDGRCHVFKGFCRNTDEQKKMISELIELIPETRAASAERKQILNDELRKSRIGQLLEFSRSVHAEVAVLLAAGRQGKVTTSTRMFVTTFPCHYCARAIIAAGVKEVQYIEAYPKSKAFDLHSDAMTSSRTGHRESESARVLFRPFTGVSPRMYERAYLKDRELKDKNTGIMKIADAAWGEAWQLPSLSYVELEARLAELKATEGRTEQIVAKES